MDQQSKGTRIKTRDVAYKNQLNSLINFGR